MCYGILVHVTGSPWAHTNFPGHSTCTMDTHSFSLISLHFPHFSLAFSLDPLDARNPNPRALLTPCSPNPFPLCSLYGPFPGFPKQAVTPVSLLLHFLAFVIPGFNRACFYSPITTFSLALCYSAATLSFCIYRDKLSGLAPQLVLLLFQ